MNLRAAFGIGVAVLAFAGLTASTSLAQANTTEVDHGKHSAALKECAKACADCQLACDECAAHCAHLLAAGKKEHLRTLLTCQDCATVCAAAARIVARGGPFTEIICIACEKACAECAKQCEKLPDDQHMRECAEECRKCEKACREMLKHLSH